MQQYRTIMIHNAIQSNFDNIVLIKTQTINLYIVNVSKFIKTMVYALYKQ